MSADRPLVFLDLDGVVNDLGSAYGRLRPWGVDVVASHGFEVHIPDFMPELVRRLAGLAEVHWLTTWRERANDEVAAHLGVGPLPVVDDGTRDGFPFWKPRAAYELARRALEEGRRVIWIEDFGGDVPRDQMPEGVEFVDTTGVDLHDAVLDPEQLGAILPDVLNDWSDYSQWLTVPLSEQRRRLIDPGADYDERETMCRASRSGRTFKHAARVWPAPIGRSRMWQRSSTP